MHGVTETIVIVIIGGFVGSMIAIAVWEIVRTVLRNR